LWFQSIGSVLGFDWHSSGLTTVVTGVLQHSINPQGHGILISGGKGKKSLLPKTEIPKLAQDTQIFQVIKYLDWYIQAECLQK